MKEHKNPKVLSEGILWMLSAVEDFGVSHLKLKVYYLSLHVFKYVSFVFLVIDILVKFLSFDASSVLQDLIDFLKEIGLQSSAAATRNASIKLLGVLHRFIGPGDWNFQMSISCYFIVKCSKVIPLADIKGFLTDVKPALLSALDTEYEKNPFEVCYFL